LNTTSIVTEQALARWWPVGRIERPEILRTSTDILARQDIPLKEAEDIFRVDAVGLEWDMGLTVLEPAKEVDAAVGADGKKIGIFLLHGGDGDFKSMEPFARLFAAKFGHKTVAMSFPGRHCFDEPDRDWPGDTIKDDGSVRTPTWKRGEHISRSEYDVVKDTSMRMRYGTRVVARAKPGTNFYSRMAGWPAAFEAGMKAAMARHFPASEYSVYVTGHSTGGPFVFMISQRVPNIQGVLAVENSPFGAFQKIMHEWSGSLGKVTGYERVATVPDPRKDPFNDLYIRTWRDCARYAGPEALGIEGPSALMRLPSLMEEVFAWWDEEKTRPQFKAEYIITHNIRASLKAAAIATAERLKLSAAGTEKLIDQYFSYAAPLTASEANPVPNVLFAIAKDSRDHSLDVYNEVVLDLFRKIEPAPRIHLTQFDASTHFYIRAEEGLPLGIGPNVAKFYHEAITGGYFLR
jgi:hypothetical protein